MAGIPTRRGQRSSLRTFSMTTNDPPGSAAGPAAASPRPPRPAGHAAGAPVPFLAGRLAHHQPATGPEEPDRALGGHRRRAERPGHHRVEGLPQVRPAGGLLRPGLDHGHRRPDRGRRPPPAGTGRPAAGPRGASAPARAGRWPPPGRAGPRRCRGRAPGRGPAARPAGRGRARRAGPAAPARESRAPGTGRGPPRGRRPIRRSRRGP